MTQEEKQLLLKDLCARLPYKVKAMYSKHEETIIAGEYERIDADGVEVIDGYLDDYCFRIDGYKIHISSIKPYLRPMSSMTEEEKEEESNLWNEHDTNLIRGMLRFYCSHHLDWNNLIPIGLALEAPKDMYKIE